jgi:hypothetical protein
MARYVSASLLLALLACPGAGRAEPPSAPAPDHSPPLGPVLPSAQFPGFTGKIEAEELPADRDPAWLPRSLQTEGLLGKWTSQVVWIDPQAKRDELLLQSPWKTDEAWNLEVLGPLFLFGQVGAAPDPVAVEALKMNGRTGLGCKIPVPLGIEVQFRGGRALAYSDPLGTDRGGERSQVFVELQCRCPLPGKIGLEYQGAAVPGLAPQERDHITQDFRFALPVGDAGKLQLGAKHQWESAPTSTRQGSDSMELYIGFELGQWSKR